MKKIMFGIFVLAIAAAVAVPAYAKTEKVDVCHFEGNGSYHVINISEEAVPAHITHGDMLAGEVGQPVSDMDEGYYYTAECEYEFYRHAEITSPETEGEYYVGDEVTFAATLWDKDKDDSVQWAVRKGTCESGQGIVWGNVDLHDDLFSWLGGMDFLSVADTTGWEVGDYCFVFNPTESVGDTTIRETLEFTLNTPSCQGFEDSQGCWHKGEPSQSCTTVCSSYGGVTPPSCQYSWKQGYNALTHFFPGASYYGQDYIGIGYRISRNEIYTSGGWNAHCGLVFSDVINVCPCAY